MIYSGNLGYPRIGKKRELKFALEKYWKGDISIDSLRKTAADIQSENWKTQKNKGIDFVPSNEFSLYDQVLDHSVIYGATPDRFKD